MDSLDTGVAPKDPATPHIVLGIEGARTWRVTAGRQLDVTCASLIMIISTGYATRLRAHSVLLLCCCVVSITDNSYSTACDAVWTSRPCAWPRPGASVCS